METKSYIKISDGLMTKRERSPYSGHRLKRVEHPTTYIGSDIKRVDEREQGFNRALRGDFGPKIQQERRQAMKKYPISAALSQMQNHLIPVVDGPIAPEKPLATNDPVVIPP